MVRINLSIKTEVATIFTDVTDFDNEQKLPLHLTPATKMCISKRQKSDIIIIIIINLLSGNPNLFLDLKQYHSLEHAATKKYIFLVRYLFC